MESWTQWFRRTLDAWDGTQEEFAHEAGIKIRMVGKYRTGSIPRAPQLAKIEAVLGPGPPTAVAPAELQTFEQRVSDLEEAVSELLAIAQAGGAARRGAAVRAGAVRAEEVARRVRARAPREGEEADEQPRQSA